MTEARHDQEEPVDEADSIPARLRAATATAHHRAESRRFVTELLEGRLSLDAYVVYLAQLALVYRALEAPRAAHADDPAFLSDAGLHRVAAIEADLAALGAADWRERIPVLQATRAYVARLDDARADSARLTAHHYTRYLGDLSGGQVIARMLERHYGATQAQLGFYRFERLGALVPYKRSYRQQLEALPWDATTVQRLLDEATQAFACNEALFDELDAHWGRSRAA